MQRTNVNTQWQTAVLHTLERHQHRKFNGYSTSAAGHRSTVV